MIGFGRAARPKSVGLVCLPDPDADMPNLGASLATQTCRFGMVATPMCFGFGLVTKLMRLGSGVIARPGHMGLAWSQDPHALAKV
jgi:hypothetical protein